MADEITRGSEGIGGASMVGRPQEVRIGWIGCLTQVASGSLIGRQSVRLMGGGVAQPFTARELVDIVEAEAQGPVLIVLDPILSVQACGPFVYVAHEHGHVILAEVAPGATPAWLPHADYVQITVERVVPSPGVEALAATFVAAGDSRLSMEFVIGDVGNIGYRLARAAARIWPTVPIYLRAETPEAWRIGQQLLTRDRWTTVSLLPRLGRGVI